MDSDDYIEPESCSKFEEKIEACKVKPDIVTGATCRQSQGKKEIILRKSASDSVITGTDYLKNELKSNFFVTVWSSIYRRDFLMANKKKKKKGYIHEDEDFTPKAFLVAENVLCTNIVFYNYIIREGSITTSSNKTKNAKCIYEISKDLLNIYDEILDKELRDLLYLHTAKICYKAIIDARLDKKKNRYIVDSSVLKKTSVRCPEKIKYILWSISPTVFHLASKLK